jgi:hypothetical protein
MAAIYLVTKKIMFDNEALGKIAARSIGLSRESKDAVDVIFQIVFVTLLGKRT